jgi:hypothetical protein
VKSGTNENISENMSSISKGEKSIPNYFKNCNRELMDKLIVGQNKGRIGEVDRTVRVRELIAVGRESKVFGEQ